MIEAGRRYGAWAQQVWQRAVALHDQSCPEGPPLHEGDADHLHRHELDAKAQLRAEGYIYR